MSTNGYSTGEYAIAVCDRCKFKYRYPELRADGAVSSLRVCQKCWDKPDPWKTWQPNYPSYLLQFPRPDQQLTTNYQYVTDNAPVIAAQERNYYRQVIGTGVNSDKGPQIQAQGNPSPDRWINSYIPPSLLPK